MPWFLALMLGFTPDGGLPPGPPSPHLVTTPHRQALWSGQAAWFGERHGRWTVRWDERNRTPRALTGPGTPESASGALVADVARLGSVPSADLVRGERRTRGSRSATRWNQSWRGAPIVDAGIDVVAQHGRVHLVWARLHRPTLTDTPRPGELVLPVDTDGRLTYHLVTRTERGDDVVYRDRSGAVVQAYSRRLPLELELPERTIGDPWVAVPARQVQVTDASGSASTDDAGVHDRTPPFDVALEGPFLRVVRDDSTVEVLAVESELLVGGDDLPTSAAAVQHHTHVVRDWLEQRAPEHAWLPDLVTASVDLEGQCNAFYTRGTINFFAAGGACENFGVIADVVFHEYGHGVHDKGLIAGSFASDVSEGSADYVSATLTLDPRVGLGAYGPESFIRDIGPDRVWPFDVVGEVHADGLIWASFLWNLREMWVAESGPERGAERTDTLFLDALALGPSLTDLYEAVLAADDDDGDLSNGTPHGCQLTELLDAHGIGPGPIGFIALEHIPPSDQPTTRDDLDVSWTLTDATPDCSRFDPDRTRLWYATEPDGEVPADGWTEVVPERSGDRYTATLPARPAGGRTVYYLSWATDTGEYPHTSHGGDDDAVYEVWWGDTAPLWCDDFEAGQGRWVFGTGALDDAEPGNDWESEWAVGAPPAAASHAPDSAPSGGSILGTNLSDDAQYRPSNAQFALSPLVDVRLAHPSTLRLEAQRWLTVERSRYDQARLTVSAVDGTSEELWRNPFDEDLLDREWQRWRSDLRELLTLGFTSVHFGWTLSSDQGLEFGGWHLDDVCVVTLAEPDVHYRSADLAAVDGGDTIELTWTDPWVIPLAESRLVRKHGAPPTGPDDGDLLGVFPGEPGARRAYSDGDAGAFALWDWHYAVFSSDGNTLWPDVVQGANAVSVLRASTGGATLPPTGGTIEGPQVREPSEAPSGCGCAAGPMLPSPLWLLVVLGAARRRQPNR
ncbi:MAG: hypothetical protein ACI8PZ_004619 [Myxococcota bacterium]